MQIISAYNNDWVKRDANGMFVLPRYLLFPVYICKKKRAISSIQNLGMPYFENCKIFHYPFVL